MVTPLTTHTRLIVLHVLAIFSHQEGPLPTKIVMQEELVACYNVIESFSSKVVIRLFIGFHIVFFLVSLLNTYPLDNDES